MRLTIRMQRSIITKAAQVGPQRRRMKIAAARRRLSTIEVRRLLQKSASLNLRESLRNSQIMRRKRRMTMLITAMIESISEVDSMAQCVQPLKRGMNPKQGNNLRKIEKDGHRMRRGDKIGTIASRASMIMSDKDTKMTTLSDLDMISVKMKTSNILRQKGANVQAMSNPTKVISWRLMSMVARVAGRFHPNLRLTSNYIPTMIQNHMKQAAFIVFGQTIYTELFKQESACYIPKINMEKDIAEKLNPIVTKKGNHVWAGALSLCWTAFKNFAKVDELKFQTENPKALRMAHNFNRTPFSEKDICSSSIYVKAGMGPETQKKINSEMKKKFPQSTMGELKYPMQPTDIIAFAYLFKQISFETTFTPINEKSFFFNGQKVASFKADNQKQKKQVCCHRYVNQNNFIVSIQGKFAKDRLFLIKDPQHRTMDDIIKRVEEAQQHGGAPLKKIDQFQMPKVEMDVTRSVDELKGVPFKNPQLKSYVLAVIMEKLKMKIDETGAKVENSAVMLALKCKAKGPEEPPKLIILNSTFWVVMKEAGHHPYLCAQIQDPIDV